MKQRNYNVDVFRAMSILLIVIYHIWVLTGSKVFQPQFAYDFVALGGEIGVTSFFALSGYGIYCSLNKQEMNDGKNSFMKHMKKRCLRILPQYYICLLIALLLTDGVCYFVKGHILDIAAHVLLIHNLVPRYFGSINGVLWTMGVIFQFYLVAIPLYRFLKKRGVIALGISILFTIMVKAAIYSILTYLGWMDKLAFVTGRQLFSALDNFMVGMYIAYLITEKGVVMKKAQGWVLLGLSIIFLDIVCRIGWRYGIHTNNLSGYIWHSLIALMIGGIMMGISFISLDFIRPVRTILLWISKYEYGIYLWHLLLINILLAKSELIVKLVQNGVWVVLYVLMIGLSISVGYLMTVMTDKLFGKWRSYHGWNSRKNN